MLRGMVALEETGIDAYLSVIKVNVYDYCSIYIVRKRSELSLPATQKALVIRDVFKGQVTEKVLDKLKSPNCEFVAVPANLFFQSLDLTVNRSAKQFMQKQ